MVLADLGHCGFAHEDLSRMADLTYHCHAAHWISHHFEEKIQPYALRAPEVILGYPWSTPVDIWTLGCLVSGLILASFVLLCGY